MKTGEMVMVTWSDGSVDCGELLEHREVPAWASIRTGRGGEMNGMVESVKYLPAEVDVPLGGVNMKPRFIGELITKNIDGDSWLLHEPFAYITARGILINVPKDFVTDMASVPFLFRRLFPKSGQYNPAAVIHDYLYKKHGFNDREVCDNIFLEAMEVCGVGYVKRYTMFWAVRAGGWMPWGDETRRI